MGAASAGDNAAEPKLIAAMAVNKSVFFIAELLRMFGLQFDYRCEILLEGRNFDICCSFCKIKTKVA